jgi:hypothetical protein
MLAIARKFSTKELQKAYRMIISWSVRLLIVGGGRSGSIEEAWASAAEKVVSGMIGSANALATQMEEAIPSDAVFRAAFAAARVSQSHLARYYLRALELKESNSAEPEWVPNESAEAVNLEHVLPQSPDPHWKHLSEDLCRALCKRIGNLVLLQATSNSALGNKPFSEKQAILAKSKFVLTEAVGKSAQWGETEIAARQQRLADLAVKTWPLKQP